MTWRAAMREALYGSGGFYARGERPAAHFRTSVHASARYTAAMLALLREVDAALGQPPRLDLVDVGAGQGELLAGLLDLAQRRPGPEVPPGTAPLAGRIVAHAVEAAPRPSGLGPQILWRPEPPDRITGLVVASEWLDNIPLDVAVLTPGGPRIVLVDPATGAERDGPAASPAELSWLREWWPLRQPGARAELGHSRSAAWAGLIGRLDRGLAVAADYGHQRTSRPVAGSMAGYRGGRPVRPIPDGSRDITAHVAIDACAAAGTAAGATHTLLTTQRAALRALGLAGRRPPLSQAERDPAGYLSALRGAAEEAELTEAAGLGGFSWLVQAVRVPLPRPLLGLRPGANSPLPSAYAPLDATQALLPGAPASLDGAHPPQYGAQAPLAAGRARS
jgi:SAM-dependent MidA family methyltransferase